MPEMPPKVDKSASATLDAPANTSSPSEHSGKNLLQETGLSDEELIELIDGDPNLLALFGRC